MNLRLDMSDVIDSPEFSDDSLTVTRLAETVDVHGVATWAPVTTGFAGVVTAVGGLELRRTPDGSTITGTISIITRERLSDGRSGQAADEVVYDGTRYTIVEVDNYTRYGDGFIQARADVLPVSGGPPL